MTNLYSYLKYIYIINSYYVYNMYNDPDLIENDPE